MKITRSVSLILFSITATFPLAAQTNVFPSSGNVGIGTASPSGQMEIYKMLPTSTSLQPMLTLTSDFGSAAGTGFGSSIIFRGRTAGNLMRENAQIAAYNENGYDNGYALGFFTSPTASTGLIQRLTILRGGNVGIGTTNPVTPLQVVGPITTGTSVGSTSGVDYLYGLYGSGKLFVVGSQYSSGASFLAYGVKAKPGASGYLSSTGIATGRSVFEANMGYLAFLTGPLQTSTDGGAVGILERMRIDSVGNVGIGTTNPTQKLSVNGTVRAKEVIVDSGWSDYVFDESYELKALSETEAFIKAEKHLPDMPSARDVAEHGVSVGEMQAKLLAKIEELTLHVIEQQKQLAAQSARIERLEGENARLSRTMP
jgi:hypothetical protein